MSEIKVNKISQRSGTAITLGNSGTDFQLPSGADIVAQSGSTITIAAGATITNSGTATGFGATGAVNWDTTPKTTTVTAVSGVGYFVNTTSGAITVNLPAGVAGAIVAVSDYANTAATNNIIIDPNGTDKINGVNADAKITTNGASITLIYVDATRGWKDVNDATLDVTGIIPFVAATGGTILTCGDFKTHVFTGPGTFTVTNAGGPTGSNSVEYLVVAGGGAGGVTAAGGGGAGGFRQNYPSPATAGLPVTAQAYPITVGGGGSIAPSSPNVGTNGVPSIFSTITSAGGGYGAAGSGAGCGISGNSGGSGGGGGGGISNAGIAAGGAGNTPPVSPSQGNSGGTGATPSGPPAFAGSGGGGAGGVGTAGGTNIVGTGGGGSPIATTFFGPTSPSYGTAGPAPGRYFAGGGGGSADSNVPGGAGGAGGGGTGNVRTVSYPDPGTVNTGGGGGAAAYDGPAQGGGSGFVAIRYKFQ
jgi:hypothetical protein